MNKKGFVFIESIVVLVVVALSLTMLISSYSLVTRKTKEKEDYNRTSDKYLLYNISSLGSSDNCNFASPCVICNSVSGCDQIINLEVGVDTNCTNNASCAKISTMIPKWIEIFDDYNIENIYVVSNIKEALNNSNAVNKYENGAIEYMKTLKKCNDTTANECNEPIMYMVGVFRRDGKFYYASIQL